MKNLVGIIRILRIALKYSAYVVVIFKTIEFLIKELENVNVDFRDKDKDEVI